MYDYKTHFADKTIVDWEPGDPVPDPTTTIPRFRYSNSVLREEELAGLEKFEQFLTDPTSSTTTGFVFGMHDVDAEDYTVPIIEILIKHKDHFPHLTTLFLGDILSEESEISWIELSDISTLFTAYPQLEHFGIRGCASTYTDTYLHLGILNLEHLKTLVVETGSMDRSVVQDVLRSRLPALEHLELWTGSEAYEANCTVEDFAPLFTDKLFPHLCYLGLRDSEITNDLAIALSQSPLLEQLQVLDLSLGTLDDSGAAALLNCPAVHKLKKLDLHHHFCSDEMMQRLQTLDIEVDISKREEPDSWDGQEQRFVAVSE
ncbi:hypothetical protein KSF_070350 [Reticulibacter mediterranei]|uniref:Cytoplasmic protein n=1 Tax=Reticulibacter mediterranei TaxID=2778369 RepID=A0A8J3IUG5_9CHLR|nr:STM4015 family protein [Reticulibacter mediterranei]GHO96987.1 hypothetical protein KSF_070350 [Reticulibacter mediterranei]